MGLIRLKKNIFLSLISVSLSGISHGYQDEKSFSTHNSAEDKLLFSPIINGKWRSKCTIDEYTGLAMRIFWVSSPIDEGRFKLKQDLNLYDDRSCRSKVFQVSTESQLTTRRVNEKYYTFRGKQQDFKLTYMFYTPNMHVGQLKPPMEFVELSDVSTLTLEKVNTSPFFRELISKYQLIFGGDLEINLVSENTYIVVKDDDKESVRISHRLFYVPSTFLLDSNVYLGNNFLENIYEQVIRAKENTYDNIYASFLSVLFINNTNVILNHLRDQIGKVMGLATPTLMRYFNFKVKRA